MVSLFDDLKQGLQEAIDYEKGTGTARKVTYLIEPVKNYDHKEIRNIRQNNLLYWLPFIFPKI